MKATHFSFFLFIWGDELPCLHLRTLKPKAQQSNSQQPFNWKGMKGRFCRFPLWCQTSTAIYMLSMTWKSREKYDKHLKNLWRPVCFQEASRVHLSINTNITQLRICHIFSLGSFIFLKGDVWPSKMHWLTCHRQIDLIQPPAIFHWSHESKK